ncbi:C4-dicarboxylate TRAP transporter substrate-binding protein [Pseudooceanicola pacificus]|nr:C4-dicarboxylate TRAP transporter substrate-binding protein [Pseudooceanicola pacificus]
MKYHTAALLGAALSLLGVAAGPSRALELTYGTYTSPTQTTFRTGTGPLLDRITRDTNGEITFEAFTGGSMGGPKELLGNAGSGIIDTTSVVDIYVKAQLPHSALMSSMLILGKNPKVMSAAMNEMQLLHCPSCEEDRTKANVIGLGWTATGTYHLICKEPINTLDELKGLKIRATSGMGRAMQSMGATAVSITTAEMYEAMQRGQVDCVAGAAAWLTTYNLKDFSRYIVEDSLGSYFGTMLFAVNLDVWGDLSDSQRAAIRSNISQSVVDTLFAYDDDHETGIRDLKALGGEVLHADQAFVDAVETARKEEYAFTIQSGKDQGIDNAEELIDTFHGLVDKWTDIVAEIGNDKEAFKAALDREIFDKL